MVGGALANDFLKAEGDQVGASLVSDGVQGIDAMLASGKLMLPVDVMVEGPDGVRTCAVDEVQPNETIVDIGPETVTELGTLVAHARLILWNGPLGLFEKGYMGSTRSVAGLIADASGYSIVGGGDTVAAIRELGLAERFSFLSTGGGAMLDFLVDGKLPGVDALIASPQA
jgi:phosphoglycerate kinase